MASYLLDTHVVLWLLSAPERVPDRVRAELAHPRHQLLVSSISGLEIATKARLGKLRTVDIASTLRDRLAEIGTAELPVDLTHALLAGSMSWEHRDPFDRVLVAQALIDNLILVTVDREIRRFDGPRLLTWPT